MGMASIAPDPTLVAMLAASDGAALLRTFAALTHRMERARQRDNRAGDSTEASLRAQRDLVQAEILRRMGETR